MLEKHIQKQILDYLHMQGYVAFKHRNVGIYKKSTGAYIPLSYGEKGISDILGITREGKFFAIEVKKPKGKVSKEQTEFIDKVNKSQGLAFVAYCIEDVIRHL